MGYNRKVQSDTDKEGGQEDTFWKHSRTSKVCWHQAEEKGEQSISTVIPKLFSKGLVDSGKLGFTRDMEKPAHVTTEKLQKLQSNNKPSRY